MIEPVPRAGDTRAAVAPLRTLLGDYPVTDALRQGRLTSSGLQLAFADERVPNKAFKRVVRNLEFDVAELALMTFLIARSRGVPLRLLPVVVFSRNPLPHLVCCTTRRSVTPADLSGCRIAVRSYTTTTAVWTRALLRDRFGVRFDRAEWIASEEGHVAGVPDPPSVRRLPGAELTTLLRAGEVDAAIVDPVPTGPDIAPVVPDPEATFHDWRRVHRAFTINHVVVVRDTLAEDRDAMRELFDLFRRSRDMAGPDVDVSPTPLGLEANRRSLEAAIAAVNADGLLARPLSIDDLITPALAALS